MPVFIRDDIRVLFLHVPKTGGTAIEQFFERNGFSVSLVDRTGSDPLARVMKCSPQHLHASILRELFNIGRFTHVFMTVRHPVSRVLSEYRMRVAIQQRIEGPNEWVAAALAAYSQDKFAIDNHIRPQWHFWLEEAEFFKQEDGYGAAWVRTMSDRLGCSFQHPLVDVAMRFDGVAEATLDPASRQRVEDFYAEDFDLFDYAR